MAKSSTITISSVNTFFGHALRVKDGLKAISDCDILLLQEVYTPKTDDLKNKLKKLGFDLVKEGGHFGLVIALKTKSSIKLKKGSIREVVVQKVGKLGVSLARKYSSQELEAEDQGILSAKFITKDNVQFTVTTTHLPVVTAPIKRAKFLRRAAKELADDYYERPLILTGDMNHYPGPKRKDLRFRQRADLKIVDLKGKITWPSKNAGKLERILGSFKGGQLDDVLFKGSTIKPIKTEVIDVQSDHKAIRVTFQLN